MAKGAARSGPELSRFQHASGKPNFKLSDFDPGDKPYSSGDKAADKEAVDALAVELDAQQNLFFADRRYKLLVVLQGIDTSGKDGTLRGVFSRMSPLGVRTVAWKAPSDEERSHDPLWRIHQQVPRAGEVTVFNRSHYEDVLVPVVNGWITADETRQRYAHIRDFERMLTETGTVICKFMLHISKDEQRERLQERIDDPAKHWKFQMDDLAVRKQWKQYQDAYEAMIAATGTAYAPWTIVPADSKTHRNLMIATVLRGVFDKLALRFPTGDAKLAGIKVE
ncbi:MAG: polyphosphate--nucleotide phosphotransferase [Rhizobacter sp.]|nr:polyphosphate--nucleotide phosphotransferase [Rhizobacter sp.]